MTTFLTSLFLFRPKLEDFFNCTMRVLKDCMPTLDAAGEAAVRAALEKDATENKMCELAGMHFEEPAAVGPNQTFPCTISKDEYKNQTGSCYGRFKTMWHNNRNDEGLCRFVGPYLTFGWVPCINHLVCRVSIMKLCERVEIKGLASLLAMGQV